MIKKKLTKFEQIGIIAVVGIAIGYFYVGRVYNPCVKKSANVRKQYRELSQKVQDLRYEPVDKRVHTFLSKQKERVSEAKKELRQIETSLAGSEDRADIMMRISRSSAEHNLKICLFDPVNETKSSGFYQRSHYNLKMYGNFIELEEFLEELGRMPKLVTVEKITIERGQDEESLEITLLLSI